MKAKRQLCSRLICKAATPKEAIGCTLTASCSEAESKGFDDFADLCGRLFDLLPKAVIMMTIWIAILYGLQMGLFDGLFFPEYGWVIGSLASIFTGVILVLGVMNKLAKIQRETRYGKPSLLQAFLSSLFLLAMLYAVFYCAGVNLVGVEKIHTNLKARASKHSSNGQPRI